MITQFKIFEEQMWNFMEGQYVVLKNKYNNKYSQFIENNVGLVTKVLYPGSWLEIKWENAPDYVERFLEEKSDFHVSDILFHSKNKEECEEYIDIKNNTKKFNL